MDARAATRNLVLATVAFAVAFVGWSLVAPLAKDFQDDLDLSNTRTLMLTAVPVILGSLLRIPVGALTDRLGGRVMFPVVLAVSALPAAERRALGPRVRLLAGARPRGASPRGYRETLRAHLLDAACAAGLTCLRGSV